MENIFFDTWEGFLRTLIMTVLGYFSMVFILRASGKRTLSKMNAFDFVVTVALGSSLATVALNNNISLVNGVMVFFLFIFLQYLISWLSVRVKSIKKIITSQPAMLLYKGEVMEDVMKKERITTEELYMAAREKGISNLEKIDLVVLETTGNLTVIPSMPMHQAETLQDVEHFKPERASTHRPAF